MEDFLPAYSGILKNGVLDEKVKKAYNLLKKCRLCARNCEVDRTKGEKGFCGLTDRGLIASFGPHYGEESPLVGRKGSGTIFLSSCNLLCIFCQNDDISHGKEGEVMSPGEIAKLMLNLEKKGCHNINFVTPSHQMPFLIDALQIAAREGLAVPVVWNCGGYESMEALNILEGIVDIYMPDFKFWNGQAAKQYCQAQDYPEVARQSLLEMHRQVGNLKMNNQGIALRGLLIRHLVMPEDLCQSEDLMKWISESLSPSTYVNVMAQYRPCYKAGQYKEIARRITDQEFQRALKWARSNKLILDQDEHPRGRLWALRDIFDL